MSDLCMACEGSPKAPNDPCAVCGGASVPQDAREAVAAALRKDIAISAAASLRLADAAIAALRACGWGNSPEIPEGWRLVPVEPTKAMEDAHFEAHAAARTIFANVPEVWRAMLSAAPSPED